MDIGYLCVARCASEAVNRHAEHLRRGVELRFHIITDRKRAELAWATQHMLPAAPAHAAALHASLSASLQPQARIYLWKPLLHLLLPSKLDRLLVLDVDTVLFARPEALWAQFTHFGEGDLLALAREQAPTYESLGIAGLNGGIQLMHLDGMRRSTEYSRALHLAATEGWLVKYKQRALLGDQTLYSLMQKWTNYSFVRTLPCGWNRQMSVFFWHTRSFKQAHQCDTGATGCSLAHGNQPAFKGLVQRLQYPRAAPTCGSCRNVTRPLPNARSSYKWALRSLLRCCCASASVDLEAALTAS